MTVYVYMVENKDLPSIEEQVKVFDSFFKEVKVSPSSVRVDWSGRFGPYTNTLSGIWHIAESASKGDCVVVLNRKSLDVLNNGFTGGYAVFESSYLISEFKKRGVAYIEIDSKDATTTIKSVKPKHKPYPRYSDCMNALGGVVYGTEVVRHQFYGYRIIKLRNRSFYIPDKHESCVVKAVFEEFFKHKDHAKTIAYVKEMTGVLISKRMINEFFQRQTYAGIVSVRGKTNQYLAMGSHEPIVSVNAFRRCAGLLRRSVTRGEDFDKLIEKKDSGCWTWKGMIVSCKPMYRNRLGSKESASRVAWINNVGPLHSNERIFRLCDNAKCISPSHHIVGKKNAQEAIKAQEEERSRAICV